VPTAALAQEVAPVQEVGEAPPAGAIDFELGLSSPADGIEGVSAWYVSPRLSARYAILDALELGLDWGVAVVSVSAGGESESKGRVGNPALSASYRLDLGSARLFVGGGVALPVAQLSDEDGLFDALALISAAAIDGNRDFWRWLPETFSLYAPARYEVMLGDAVRVTADGAFAVYIPTSEGGEARLGIQLGGALAYVHDRSWVGVRLQLTSVQVNLDDVDLTQLSLVPEGRLDLGGGYLNGRLVVNLDQPYGFAFDTGRIWGVFVGGGVYL